MGEIAEMMLEGILCEGCGEFMGGRVPGYPRRCRSCGPAISLATALKRPLTPGARRNARHNRERHEAAKTRKQFECDKCHRLFRTSEGVLQHAKDKHGWVVL
jgi:hypothetical protein